MSELDSGITTINKELAQSDNSRLRAQYKDILVRASKVSKMPKTETRRKQIQRLNQEYKYLLDWEDQNRNKGAS